MVAAIALLLLLLLRCTQLRPETGKSGGGDNGTSVTVVPGGGSGGAGTQRDGAGSASTSGGGGGGASGKIKLQATPGSGGGDTPSGGGGGGGEVGSGGSAQSGELELVGSAGAGGSGSGTPDQAGVDPGGKRKNGASHERSRLEDVLAKVSWGDFSREVFSVRKGDATRSPVPGADSASVELGKQLPSKEWQRIDVSITDVPWKPIVIGAATFEKVKQTGQPMISWQSGKRFYRASFIGGSPAEENWDGESGEENRMTFSVAKRWQVFILTRRLPDSAAAEIARMLDLALLETLAAQIPAGTP